MAVLVVGKCWRWQKRISVGKGKIVLARSGKLLRENVDWYRKIAREIFDGGGKIWWCLFLRVTQRLLIKVSPILLSLL